MKLIVTSDSQTDRPRGRATEATWLWNGARGPKPVPLGEISFCEVGPLTVRQQVAAGDGGPMPSTVVVDGLTAPDAGYYDRQNVLVRSNGDLRLVAHEQTRVTRVDRSYGTFTPV